MQNLIPYFIQQQFERNVFNGRFQAAALFADISGFTPLTETLMAHQKDGAEALTDALNHIFSPLVAAVYTHDGFITTFAGDAFTALFPLDADTQDAPGQAAETAVFIQNFFAREGVVSTK